MRVDLGRCNKNTCYLVSENAFERRLLIGQRQGWSIGHIWCIYADNGNGDVYMLARATWRWSDHFDVMLEIRTWRARLATHTITTIKYSDNRVLKQSNRTLITAHCNWTSDLSISRNQLPLIFQLHASHVVEISKAIGFSRLINQMSNKTSCNKI